MEELKQRALRQLIDRTTDPRLAEELRWAAREAAALAWATPVPTLVFPALLEEKMRLARLRWERQRQILRRAGPILAFAA